MFQSINLNTVSDHIKNIYVNSCCNICDRYNGIRMRFSCGHTGCDHCVKVGDYCTSCLTSPQTTSTDFTVDKCLTQRSKHAYNLLNTFQNEFNVNVLNRHRLSEQLKVEKELFPQCIQAPVKYFNKRKSLKTAKCNKENQTFLGEEVARTKMENSNKNVQQWLNKYVRKPFSEINPNSQRLPQDYSSKNNQITRTQKQRNRKRPYLDSQYFTNTNSAASPIKRTKIFGDSNTKGTQKILIKNTQTRETVNDESGIVIDDDESVISLDDSKSDKYIDKDVEALHAVLEAENNITHKTSINSTKGHEQYQTEAKNETINMALLPALKVPFYKKGQIIELCERCNKCDDNFSDEYSKQNKNFAITIENKSYTAVIKVTQEEYNVDHNRKQSVQVQSDLSYSTNEQGKNNNTHLLISTHKNVEKIEPNILSDQNVLVNNKKHEDNIHDDLNEKKSLNMNKSKNVIIEETDSDEDIEPSLSLVVTADVHQSYDQIDYGILNDVENLEAHSSRPRRAPRGLTPSSTDSSEKENYNPNRMKAKMKSKKKHKK